jgi:phosphopantothenoylcysteine synthetase/decarboxylase
MNVLVTAGNTRVPIDRVRCITNIFTGRTGAAIAVGARRRGHAVTLLTSNPEVVAELGGPEPADGWRILRYRTFDDLQRGMSAHVLEGGFDAVIHCAAVSDYRAAGIYAPALGTHFHPADGQWTSDVPEPPALIDRAAAKVKSDEPELWLRLQRAPKLIDLVRTEWRFTGVLVKFKLEVEVSDEQLLEVAEASRRHSQADLMVANTLEAVGVYAHLGPIEGRYVTVSRQDLADRLMAAVEELHARRGAAHG